ncbi:MAG: bifunctional UDP-sugar hydrolase/5'-nucleotidase [Bacteroidales bacterium]|nr:bifunctional UDP-sugar hydrolase/5'-nucleotidase [Bacteroidales bacterium]
MKKIEGLKQKYPDIKEDLLAVAGDNLVDKGADLIMYRWLKYLLFFAILFQACHKNEPVDEGTTSILTIFSINDPHGQINNFSKIKYIVDEAELSGNVLVVSGGDIFSGNPVVDFVDEKGFAMIDLMNRSGFDAAVLGNHEFDYGQAVLKARMEQAEFDFICANADMSASIVPQPDPYTTISVGNLDVTFLGMVQTSYTSGAYIPATHPLKLEGISFQQAQNVINDYATLKEDTESDILVLLSHLGANMDNYMATNYPYMDLIIGGHSHAIIDDIVNDIPIYQCGANLNYLGKITLTIKDRALVSEDFELINLNTFTEYNSEMALLIDNYNNVPELEEVIGYTGTYLSRGSNLGCFYTDALREALNTDVSFQNGGGLRADIDAGDITVREIYEMDPFNNGAHVYSMRAEDLKRFLGETGAGLNYSGIIIENDLDGRIIFKRESGTLISDEEILTIGINDYIPAVYKNYFANPTVSGLTTAEHIIEILRVNPTLPDYSGCNRYYKY